MKLEANGRVFPNVMEQVVTAAIMVVITDDPVVLEEDDNSWINGIRDKENLWALQYLDSSDRVLYDCASLVTRDVALQSFVAFHRGDIKFKELVAWKRSEVQPTNPSFEQILAKAESFPISSETLGAPNAADEKRAAKESYADFQRREALAEKDETPVMRAGSAVASEPHMGQVDHWSNRSANPSLVCPHCQTRGQVWTKSVTGKVGVSGGKATAALLTVGLSLLAVGLSRKAKFTEAFCKNCQLTWQF